MLPVSLPSNRIAPAVEPCLSAAPDLPTCPVHADSLIRRYRTHGPNGPGVYPQCVPSDDARPHLLEWAQVQRTPTRRNDTTGLSPSERDVLDDAASGMTVIETAGHRSKSPETVKSQRRSIMLKLGARNMAQAVGMMAGDGVHASLIPSLVPVEWAAAS